jgi:hypothetical protein
MFKGCKINFYDFEKNYPQKHRGIIKFKSIFEKYSKN